MRKLIEYFGGEKRFYVIMFMWFFSIMMLFTLFYLKADEVTKDPCSICAKKLGEKVNCRTNDLQPIVRDYYPNFTITQDTSNRKGALLPGQLGK